MKEFLTILFYIVMAYGFFWFSKGLLLYSLLLAKWRFKKFKYLGKDLPYNDKEQSLRKKALKNIGIGFLLLAICAGVLNLIEYAKLGQY